MKVSQNFDIREFVPKDIWEQFGARSIMFIDKRIVNLAEFYKFFFKNYYNDCYSGTVKDVLINVNDWQWGGDNQYRGYRPPVGDVGAYYSQHKFGRAFDCDIIISFKNETKKEADYKEVHQIISDYNREFYDNGLRVVEDVNDAPTWLHSDIRETDLLKIQTVGK